MSDAAFTDALVQWCRYHVATEAFDRSISSLRNPRTGDAIIDHDPWIRRRSYRFARRCAAHMAVAADRRIDQQAKEVVSGWSYEAQLRFLEQAP